MGKIHSFESFGTVDGPGVRFVVFMQGCPMRCKYCHNPDTWSFNGGKELSCDEVLTQIMKYKNYIKDGGVTVSGGEPLVQLDFVIELFEKLKQKKIHTCIDTSGILFDCNDSRYDKLCEVCDLFLVDIKHIDENKHLELTGLSSKKPKEFLKYLDFKNKDVWIRHVLVDGYTNSEEYLFQTKEFIQSLQNVKKVEVLPYHTLGLSKYEKMNLDYPLKGVNTPSKEEIERAKKILGEGYVR